jgi:hypothetical protein
MRAVAAVKADKTKALEMFNTGGGGFLDRDLYPFCYNIGDGKLVAVGNPIAKQLLGQDVRTFTDAIGKMFGLEQYFATEKSEGTSLKAATCSQGQAHHPHLLVLWG